MLRKFLADNRVAVTVNPVLRYPAVSPYHPSQKYPEYPFADAIAPEPNPVYDEVRKLFSLLQFDKTRFGTAEWNPLGEFIKPGDRVVIKPNWVAEDPSHLKEKHCIRTHTSVLRALLDYVWIALQGKGRILICDVPLQSSSFEKILLESRVQEMLALYPVLPSLELAVRDLRSMIVETDRDGFILRSTQSDGDGRGFVPVDLGGTSELEDLIGRGATFGVTDYDRNDTNDHHASSKHEYLIPASILESDVFINVPKMKVHQKAGLTLAMKNLIGINADKSWLPHFRVGSSGDEFPPTHRFLGSLNSFTRRILQGRARFLYAFVRSCWRLVKSMVFKAGPSQQISEIEGGMPTDGAWFGNDTLWRTIRDLNRVIFFADSQGTMRPDPQRKYFALVDGIVVSEGNGPLRPVPKHCGALVAGFDPLCVDAVGARMMGFDYRKIPQTAHPVRGEFSFSRFEGEEGAINVVSEQDEYARMFAHKGSLLGLDPPIGWRDHIELE